MLKKSGARNIYDQLGGQCKRPHAVSPKYNVVVRSDHSNGYYGGQRLARPQLQIHDANELAVHKHASTHSYVTYRTTRTCAFCA